MKTLDGKVGLVAGAAAALAYIILVIFVNLDLVLAIVPAAAVAGAVLLVAPGGPMGKRLKPTDAEAKAMAKGREILNDLTAKVKVMPARKETNAHKRLESILVKADRVLDVIESDWNKFAAADHFLQKVLEPMQNWLERYLRVVGRDIDFGKDVIVRAEEETLPYLERSLNAYFDQLHVNDIAGLMMSGEVQLKFPKIDLKLEDELK